MKLTLIIFWSFLSCFQASENKAVWPWNALLKVNQKKVTVYNTYNKAHSQYYIENDTIKENYLVLKIIAKKGDMFKIKFAYVRNEKQIHDGWIESKYVGTYLRSLLPRDVYPIYDKPIERSAFHNVTNISNEMVDVIEISDHWVKVRMTVKGKAIIGWLPLKYTCPDPYASCT